MGNLVILHGNIVDDNNLKLGEAIVLPTNGQSDCRQHNREKDGCSHCASRCPALSFGCGP